MKRILLTGARGFVGRHLQSRLITQGYAVRAFEGDIRNKDLFEKYAEAKFDHFIHLAAKSFVPESWNNPDAYFETNVCGVQNVVEFCRKNSLPLTYVSSYLYGNPAELPIKESAKLNPTNPYAFTKYLAESICKFYADNFNLNVTVVRPFNVYGPGQSESYLIPELVKKLVSDDPAVKVLDLTPKRDYIYIDDLVELIVLTVENTRGYNVFNAGSGTSLSVKEVIDMIAEILAVKKKIESSDIVRKNEIPDTVSDNSKALATLGWKPVISFREGLERIIRSSKQ